MTPTEELLERIEYGAMYPQMLDGRRRRYERESFEAIERMRARTRARAAGRGTEATRRPVPSASGEAAATATFRQVGARDVRHPLPSPDATPK